MARRKKNKDGHFPSFFGTYDSIGHMFNSPHPVPHFDDVLGVRRKKKR